MQFSSASLTFEACHYISHKTRLHQILWFCASSYLYSTAVLSHSSLTVTLEVAKTVVLFQGWQQLNDFLRVRRSGRWTYFAIFSNILPSFAYERFRLPSNLSMWDVSITIISYIYASLIIYLGTLKNTPNSWRVCSLGKFCYFPFLWEWISFDLGLFSVPLSFHCMALVSDFNTISIILSFFFMLHKPMIFLMLKTKISITEVFIGY